jgi:hypothetical protein
MKIPYQLKAIWWFILVGVLTIFLSARLPDLLSGKAAAADVAVFGVWMALLLAPLFTEVSLLGITLKNEIGKLKDEIGNQLADVRTELKNAIDIRTSISPTIHFPSPAADALIPAVEEQVKAAVAAAFAERGLRFEPKEKDLSVSDDTMFLFKTRYHIERELRRIATGRDLMLSNQRRYQPAHVLASALVDWGLLSARLGNAVREVYAVCSAAIHGENISEKQVAFVRDVGGELVSALHSIE